MRMVCLGLNHRTAPVEIRERFAVPSHRLQEEGRRIRSLPDVWARLRDHMEKYAKTYLLPDQTVINRFFAGEIAELPQAWNFPPTPGSRDPAAARAAIWHFYNQQPKPYCIGKDDVGATLLEWNRILTSASR